jgi:hypothetical protein
VQKEIVREQKGRQQEVTLYKLPLALKIPIIGEAGNKKKIKRRHK